MKSEFRTVITLGYAFLPYTDFVLEMVGLL